MSVLILMIPLALSLGALALFTFLWSLKSGQYEDLDGAAQRVLLDDDPADARSSSDSKASTPSLSTLTSGGRSRRSSTAGLDPLQRG
jgi:cbb3-type cytochrome oxidase maturation protein